MARKSRRNPEETAKRKEAPLTKSEAVMTAAYVRLSSEAEDGDTIDTQRKLVESYISSDPLLRLYDVYIDNGYSGTNFNRPQFQKLMADARTGKVQCIVVKDLSRFGRNFLETSWYIETMLPKLNVRLIAINDHFDSSKKEDRESITVPVNNMVNEIYARDISKKICASNIARRESGNYTIEKCIFGYQVDKENNEFLVNPETAPVVQLIFRWYLAGLKRSEIAARLNTLGIMTPREYKYQTEFEGELPEKDYWRSSNLKHIITKEAYIGNRCLGMRLTRLYKNQPKEERLPREKWTVYEDDHEPLIALEDFEEASGRLHAMREERAAALRRNAKKYEDGRNLFSGLVYCRHCGKIMYHESGKNRNGRLHTERNSYVCKPHPERRKGLGCNLRVKDDFLEVIVTNQLQVMIDSVIDLDALVKSAQKSDQRASKLQRLESRIGVLNIKLSENENKTLKLYEDFSQELLDEEDYQKLHSKCRREHMRIESDLEAASKELLKMRKSLASFEKLSKSLRKQTEHIHLSRELVRQMIERIDVSEKHEVEITFRFRDVFEDVQNLIGEEEA